MQEVYHNIKDLSILITKLQILIFMKKIAALISVLMLSVICYLSSNVWSPVVVNATAQQSVDLPIVMYHSVLKSRQSKYVVTPTQIEKDFEAYQKMGYTPVFMREVIDFVDGQGSLPQKPMVITFDDGHYNNMHYVLPIAKKFDFKFVINPVTSFSVFSEEKNDHSNPAYSYLMLNQMAELEKSGLVEIGNHTHNMHKFNPRYGIKQKSNESTEKYVATLTADIQKAQDLLAANGVTRPTTFAYPFGAYNTTARDTLISIGFRAFLTCNEGVSKVTLGDPASLYSLKRYNRSGNTTTDSFIKKVFAKLEGEDVPK